MFPILFTKPTKRISTGITYLLQDQFTTNAAAPLSSPRTCEPGPGSLTLTQTDGNLAIASNALSVSTPQATPAFGDLGWSSVAGIARACGRALIVDQNVTVNPSTSHMIGWTTASTANVGSESAVYYFRNHSTGGDDWRVQFSNASQALSIGTFVLNTAYTMTIVLRTTGAWFFVSGGAFDTWPNATLLWALDQGTTATVYPSEAIFASTITHDNLRVTDLGGSFSTQNGIATNVTASPATGATSTSTANAIIEFTWTAATGETLDIMTRYVDDSNCWITRCDQGGSTIKLFEKNAGVETQRATAAQTWTNGTTYTIVVSQNGNTIKNWVRPSGSTYTAKNSYASASFQNTATGVKVSGFATGANLICWPKTVTFPTGV